MTDDISVIKGEAFVWLQWGENIGRFTPAEARMHALAILEAAEAVQSDGLVYQEMAAADIDVDTIRQFLASLRGRRLQRDG